MKRQAVIGIDPGLKGGIAVIPHSNPGGVQVHPMPLGPDGKNIDYRAVCAILGAWAGPVYIEKVHAMPKQGVSSVFKFGMGFGGVLGVCGALGRRVEQVPPQRWQNALFGPKKERNEEDTTKVLSVRFAHERFPQVSLTPGRTRKPQDGLSDALCIATFGLIQENA